MSNILNLLSEDTFAEKMDAQNTLLAAIASSSGGLKITSWQDVQRVVRLGLASKIFSIGDQFVCESMNTVTAGKGNSTGITAVAVVATTFIAKMGSVHSGAYEFTFDGSVWSFDGNTVILTDYGITLTGTAVKGDTVVITETTTLLAWDVIGIDCDTPSDSQFSHSLTLQMHNLSSTVVAVDATEALYYAETGLTAGTYYFTLLSGYDTAYGGGKTLQFTLANAVPAGGQILFPWAYNTQSTATMISTYASKTSTTVIETVSVIEGTSGTNLGTADGTTTNMNHSHKIRYGSNRYSQSAIRQWINSNGAIGAWWSPTNKFDRPAPQLSSAAGFLYGMDKEFLSVLGNVNKRTALNTITDGSGYEDTKERFFLLSRSEVYGGNENNVVEGNPYPYYANYSALSAAGTGVDANRIKYKNGTATSWWLRSCISGSGYSVRYVSASGGIYDHYAYDTYGVAPACCII